MWEFTEEIFLTSFPYSEVLRTRHTRFKRYNLGMFLSFAMKNLIDFSIILQCNEILQAREKKRIRRITSVDCLYTTEIT